MRANHHGWCGICDDAIRPGDDIRPGEDEADWWVHVDCLPRAVARPPDLRRRCLNCADVLVDGRCPNCGT